MLSSTKTRVIDISEEISLPEGQSARIKKLGAEAPVRAGETCLADAEIFATGKIIDQVWRGINAAKVLVAELTTRNANVFYELGLAHALNKPVVLVSSNETDVPFDLHHIRVIYYDVNDCHRCSGARCP
jgi:nucleoside 2-deoxyribosyltransferase